jgi:hypothetical protein
MHCYWRQVRPYTDLLVRRQDAVHGARCDQRDIDITDAVEVLRLGEIEGPIESGVNPEEWKCKVTAKVDKSSRRLGVATVVIRNEELFLLTVEWEDAK